MTLVETKNTILSIEEITYALKEGWFLNFNYYPTKEQLAVLWAQACLETGRGKFLRNYNFGNIKRTKDHMYCQYECSEIINGKEYKYVPPHPETSFNAYPSAVEGAKEYIQFLIQRKRYLPAWEQVLKGDPVAYCAELKKAGYFTADLNRYTKGVVALCDEFKSKADKLMTYAPPKEEPIKEEPVKEELQEEKKNEPEVKTQQGFFTKASAFVKKFKFF